MDFLEIMRKRYSCRAFDPEKSVSREDLLKIVEAGRLTPSGCNSQPWTFIVVDSPEAKEKLCDALVLEGGASGAPWRHQVSAFIMLVEQPARVMKCVVDYYKDSQRFAPGDLGAACMNMCHEAYSLGLGTCIIGMNDQAKLEEYFHIPQGRQVRMVLAVGYDANGGPAFEKVRKDLSEVCSFNDWE